MHSINAFSRLLPLVGMMINFASFCSASFETITEHEIRCSGVYGQDTFPKGVPAFVSLTLHTPPPFLQGHWGAAVAIMDFKDFDALGYSDGLGVLSARKFICDKESMDGGLCTKSEQGHYLLNDKFKTEDFSLQSHFFTLKDNETMEPVHYQVNKTGYICVSADLVKIDNETGYVMIEPPYLFKGLIEWSNPYGKLPAAEHPKLTFYGTMSILYLIIGVIWVIGCFRYWQDILPIQTYISGVLLFLIIEMASNYGYLDNYNHTGRSSYPLLVLVVILDAGRNSLCFFILLLVSLGYGVLKPSLGTTMKRCQLLTVAHFMCGCLYGAGSMLTDPDRIGLVVFVFVLPLSFTMTAFYIWIMQSMAATIEQLEQRQQYIKLQMYCRLRFTIIGSIAILLAFFVVNGLFFHKAGDRAFINNQWQTRWFLVDGWLSLLFFTIFAAILWLWRPTDNNQKYGLQELAQDEATADALDLEARPATDDLPNRLKSHPGYPDDGVNIFDIGGDDDEDIVIANDNRRTTSPMNSRPQ